MRQSEILAITASTATAYASSVSDVCTYEYVQASLPTNGTLTGITIDPSSVTANPVYNASTTGETMWPDATFDYCNVTFAYSHNGLDGDKVNLWYWLPAPQKFQKRFLTTGGMAYDINGGSSNLAGGVMYGAVSGLTDGGFGGFGSAFDDVFLYANGSINYQSLFMMGYQGIYEMTAIGKDFTKLFFNMTDEKVYTYYQSCSEGGREGWSQVQRYGDAYDGVIAGAPAMRQGQQQTNHLTSAIVEQTLDYYPPPCELAKIVNATISACDALDGKVDGVVSRTDLCKLHFNINSTIGLPYYCAAETSTSLGLGFSKRLVAGSETSTTPAQNGTVSAQAVAVAQTILDGLHDTEGKRAYLSYQPAAEFTDAETTYDNTTASWGIDIPGTGGEWVARFLELRDASNLDTLDNVTYDTLRDWMIQGWQMYENTLQTTLPDLTPFYKSGGKVLHFHGESDPSVPTGSSVLYHESVRKTMYPNLSFNESTAALSEWYRLYLVPGAAHCGTNSLQPNGPFPQTNLQVMINWVENGIVPITLNATHLAGDYEGENAQICTWPLRPYYSNNGTTLECQYDQASIDTWMYDFDAYKMPLY